MLLTLSGLLTLLLDPSFITGQLAEERVNISKDGMMDCDFKTTWVSGSVSDNATHEDKEDFQNQMIHHYSGCNEILLKDFGESYCLCVFGNNMMELGEKNWCEWEEVLGFYYRLTECLENLAKTLTCYYPNAVVQELFIDVHKQYFSLCQSKDDILLDAPPGVVLILTLLPVSIIPFLVYMVIWKSSVSD